MSSSSRHFVPLLSHFFDSFNGWRYWRWGGQENSVRAEKGYGVKNA